MVQKNIVILLMISGMIWGCNPYSHEIGRDQSSRSIFSADNLVANLRFLTADDLEGREATQRGEKLSALFLSAELQKYGVVPWIPGQGYLQSIDLKLIRFSENSQLQLIGQQGQVIYDYIYGTDFTGASRYYPVLNTTAGMVFAGYGITAPEYNYDDYAKVGAEGKVVIIFYGEPVGGDSAHFDGKKDSRYSFLRHKTSNASKHGAIGIMILSQLEKSYGWDRVQAYIQKGSLQLKNSSGEDEQRPDMDRVPSVTISEKLLPSLFAAEKYSADSLLILLANRHSLPAFLLQKRLRLHWEFRSDSIMQAQNVVGMIPGNDVDLQHEYVGIGAHYDHIGMSGDTVFNGADDNASGTVAIMEAARALARNRHNKRSILIILHTAEEKGLLGSKYMSQQPELTDRMMAYINLDMVGCGPVDSLYSVGADHISSELQEIVEKTNAGSVRFKFNYELNNPNHPERIYYRSDHYSYARKGIPVVFFTDFYMKEYHTPGDDLEKLNIDKITRVAELTYRLALELANHPGKLKSN